MDRKNNKYVKMRTFKPRQEFRDGLGAEDGRFITTRNAVNIMLNIFISDNRHNFFESLSISIAIKITIALQVLDVRISRKYFSKDSLLDLISFGGNFFNEMKSFLVFFCNNKIVGFWGILWCLRHC